jgi:hypothetical protein
MFEAIPSNVAVLPSPHYTLECGVLVEDLGLRPDFKASDNALFNLEKRLARLGVAGLAAVGEKDCVDNGFWEVIRRRPDGMTRREIACKLFPGFIDLDPKAKKSFLSRRRRDIDKFLASSPKSTFFEINWVNVHSIAMPTFLCFEDRLYTRESTRIEFWKLGIQFMPMSVEHHNHLAVHAELWGDDDLVLTMSIAPYDFRLKKRWIFILMSVLTHFNTYTVDNFALTLGMILGTAFWYTGDDEFKCPALRWIRRNGHLLYHFQEFSGFGNVYGNADDARRELAAEVTIYSRNFIERSNHRMKQLSKMKPS